jgi:transcription elongation factor GreA
MSNNSVVYVTEEGLQKINEELLHLTTVRREEISERLEVAIAHGDLSENADYDYAKSEQAFVEGRIKDLEDSLRRAKIIDNGGQTDKVRVGSTVTVFETGFEDDLETYHIVGIHEADPSKGRISNESPIGLVLLGQKVGDTVSALVPSGKISFTITAIM